MKVKRGRRGRKKVSKFALPGIREWDLGYQALGEGVSTVWKDTVGLRKGQGEGRGKTICFATVICGGRWGELAGRCFSECFPRLRRTFFFFFFHGNLDGECCGPSRKINCHQTPYPHGYKINTVLEWSQKFLA